MTYMKNFREAIKENLALLTEKHRLLFKRMYSCNDLELSISDVVDNMPENELKRAMEQIERTLDNLNKKDGIKRKDEMYNLVNELIYLPGGLCGFIKVKNESSEETKKLLDELLILSINQKEVKL